MPDEDHLSIQVGCNAEFVECDDCSFLALQLTIDGAPSGELCIVMLGEID